MANSKQGGTGFLLIPNICTFQAESWLFACDFNNYWQREKITVLNPTFQARGKSFYPEPFQARGKSFFKHEKNPLTGNEENPFYLNPTFQAHENNAWKALCAGTLQSVGGARLRVRAVGRYWPSLCRMKVNREGSGAVHPPGACGHSPSIARQRSC